jgi:hypothetical protein
LQALGVGAVTSIAWIPIGVTIVVGLAVGWRLESLDKKYYLTDKLVAALEKLGDQMVEVQAQSKLGQFRGQEAQFIGQARLSEMQPFGR